MKNFLYAAAESVFTTSSGTSTERILLNIPCNKINPQTWLILCTWQLSGDGSLGEAQVQVESTGLEESVLATHTQSISDLNEVESGGTFKLAREVSGDFDVKIKIRSLDATDVSMDYARILAIRIPEHYKGTLLYDEFTTSTALIGNGTKEVHASVNGEVVPGRYLALSSAGINMPAGGGKITTGMNIIQGIAPTTAGGDSEEMVEMIPEPFETGVSASPGEAPARLTRSHDATDERDHPFFHMGVTTLSKGTVSCVLETQADQEDSPADALIKHSRVLLLRLDGLFEFYDARSPGKFSPGQYALKNYITNGAGRRQTSEIRDTVRLGFAVMGHQDATTDFGGQMIIRDMESPKNTLATAQVGGISYATETRELILATVTSSGGPMELAVADINGSPLSPAVFSSGVLLTLIDEQSQRSDVPVSFPIEYDWDLSGALLTDRVDLETLEKLKQVANDGVPTPTVETVEVVSECFDRTRLAVRDRLFSKNGSENWTALG